MTRDGVGKVGWGEGGGEGRISEGGRNGRARGSGKSQCSEEERGSREGIAGMLQFRM